MQASSPVSCGTAAIRRADCRTDWVRKIRRCRSPWPYIGPKSGSPSSSRRHERYKSRTRGTDHRETAGPAPTPVPKSLEGGTLPIESKEDAWDFSYDEFKAGRRQVILALPDVRLCNADLKCA